MILPAFRLHRPATVEEAIAAAASCGEGFDWLAGGTDLLPNYKNRLNPRADVIALWRVAGLDAVGERSIGAMARLSDLEADPGVRRRWPALVEAIGQVATPLVRRQATLGGNVLLENRCYYFNQSLDWRASKGYCMKADGDVCLVVPQKEICYAAYQGDTAPVLMVLDASFLVEGIAGPRRVRAADFYRPDGIRRNVLARGELLVGVTIPPADGLLAGYSKLRLRDSFDFPDAGVAAALRLDGDVVEEIRIAVTGVSMTPLAFPEVTDAARGARLTPDLIERIASKVAARTQPVRNVMFPPQYRKRMVGLHARRLLTRLAGGAGRGDP